MMYVIINKETKQGRQTIEGIIPVSSIEISENELVVEVSDASMKAKIKGAWLYNLEIDDQGSCLGVTVLKTLAEFLQENPLAPPEPTEIDYLLDLDFRLSMVELGLN